MIPDVEGYNEAGLLADKTEWDFDEGNDYMAKMTFEKASKDIQHTEKNVTTSTFSKVLSAFDKVIGGVNVIPDTGILKR